MLPADLLRTVLESAPDAIVIVDGSGQIVFANRQVTALFGYQAGELAELGIEMLIPERFRASHVRHRHDYGDNMRWRSMGAGLELFARHKDGREIPVEVSLSPIRNHGDPLVAAAIRDVTERKKFQAELLAAREAADRANQSKSRFLATASHDLRQPLQSLSLLNAALRRTVHDSGAQEILQHEMQAIESMSRLLNALLDISRLESGAIQPAIKDFGFEALLGEMRNEFSALAESKGLEFRVEGAAATVRSDPALIGQILRNLLANAIKYTVKGWVALRCVPQRSTLRIEVADSGIGIPADKLAHIYDEFYQIGSDRGSPQHGYGLGLSIVRRLVSLLNLRLDVTSLPEDGSIFAIELPLSATTAEAAPARAGAAAPAPRRARAPRILLVEDDPGVRDATRMLLTVEGYQVATAASVGEAIEKVTANPDLDLLVTDYHLGKEATGTDVISRVRKIVGRPIGAILVTGDTSPTIRNLRIDEKLRVASKPIDADELLRQIETLIAR
jgi:PAS domain S-box-containing protein